MKKLICFILALALCGCATTGQQEIPNLQAQVRDLQAAQCVTGQRLVALEQKAENLDLREKQLAVIINEMLFGHMKSQTTIIVVPKTERTAFEACLTACWPKLSGSSTGMDPTFGEACKGIPECDKFVSDEDTRQQLVP